MRGAGRPPTAEQLPTHPEPRPALRHRSRREYPAPDDSTLLGAAAQRALARATKCKCRALERPGFWSQPTKPASIIVKPHAAAIEPAT